jgi:hypothetical protein
MNIMDYQVEKEKPKTKGLVIKNLLTIRNIGKTLFMDYAKSII